MNYRNMNLSYQVTLQLEVAAGMVQKYTRDLQLAQAFGMNVEARKVQDRLNEAKHRLSYLEYAADI